jgi:hypothetical protein
MNIIDIIDDERFFKPLFRDISTWEAWKVFLKALFGIPITDKAEKRLFRQCTGLKKPGSSPAKEAYVIAGRRSGKSYISSIIAGYLAAFKDWKRFLNPGEKGWIFIIANDRAQAKIIKGYISGILNSNVMFRRLIERELQWEIELKNGVGIAVKTCNFRTIRGYTVLAAICEEIAFWRDEYSANPAKEILTALRPSLATIPESFLIGISTPYSRFGYLWEQFTKHFGKVGDEIPLVWRAPTNLMNPTVNEKLIQDALKDDYSSAKSEWLAEWREDIEAFLSLEMIDAVVVPYRFELPRIENAQYYAYIDPSGGRRDSFTLAICHKEDKGKYILDYIREIRPPFQPGAVVSEFSEILKSYGVNVVESDRYAAEWVTSSFQENGIMVENSELTSSEIYLNFLPLIANSFVELLDNKRITEQLRGLERKTRTGGKDQITHPPFAGTHDDLAIAVAGAIVRAARNAGVVRDNLEEIWAPAYTETKEERFNSYIYNWLFDKPQKSWTAEDDMEDLDDFEKINY